MTGIEETICPNCKGDCAYLPGARLYLCIRCGAFGLMGVDFEDEEEEDNE